MFNTMTTSSEAIVYIIRSSRYFSTITTPLCRWVGVVLKRILPPLFFGGLQTVTRPCDSSAIKQAKPPKCSISKYLWAFSVTTVHHSSFCYIRTTQKMPDFHYVDLLPSSEHYIQGKTDHLRVARNVVGNIFKLSAIIFLYSFQY